MKTLDLRVGDRYRLQRRIGGGSCGAVYIATDIDNGNEVAIKLEHRSIEPSFLSNEACIYESLSGGPGILRVHDYYGQECDYSAMVFDLLGPSLEDLYKFCGRKFTLKTVLLLADQLIARLQYIHSKGFIHQDIKPSNLLLGTGKAGNLVYITDLGLACERSTAKEVARYYHTDRPRLIGTQLFASYRGHLGVVQHRRDDLESLGYTLLYFIRALPWQRLAAANKDLLEELVLEKKKTISVAELCDGLPQEFTAYFNHIRSLAFDENPNYAYLRKNFRNLFVRQGFEYDHVFDWTILKYRMATQQQQVLQAALSPG